MTVVKAKHAAPMIKPQPYYRLAEKSSEISLVKIHLTPRVIYLKELSGFMNPDNYNHK